MAWVLGIISLGLVIRHERGRTEALIRQEIGRLMNQPGGQNVGRIPRSSILDIPLRNAIVAVALVIFVVSFWYYIGCGGQQ